MNPSLLKKIGLSDKSASMYLALLRLGPSSVRALAEETGLNRGTTHDTLKLLQEKGLISFYKKASKQHFVAEPPEKLTSLLEREQTRLHDAAQELEANLSELQALYNKGGQRPIARYFESQGITTILEDVLATCEQAQEKVYRIYSPVGVRKFLYDEFPLFSDARIAKGIAVKAIAIGDGGELRGLDERKWLKTDTAQPTYILMYPGKTAYISLNAKGEPIGVVIENEGVFQTQKTLFDALWKYL